MIKKTLIIVFSTVVFLNIVAFQAYVLNKMSFGVSGVSTNSPKVENQRDDEYFRGVNDALDTITLLSLEQNLQGTNRTWGAMGNVVRERLGVAKRSLDNL